MSCHICSRAPTSRLRYQCPSCARNRLYQLRIDNARLLLEKESIARQIENSFSSRNTQEVLSLESEKGNFDLKDENPRAWTVQTVFAEQAKSSVRVKILADHIENLRLEIKSKQLDISERRLALARRHSDAESANYQLVERESAMLAGIQNNTKRTDYLWHSLHSKTAEARIFLCREAANLYGLRQRVKKNDGATPAQLSTSFSYIAHLLVLVSHYLSLRLPAEITLPHRNHPSPTIYAPSGSYLSRELVSMAPPPQFSPSSPTASRAVDWRSHFPRPRPLSSDRTLPKLAREDPAAYALFLEGATLLAWNVSWLCRTQGLSLASDSWDDICDLGKNMWQLLVAPPAQAMTLMRAFASRDLQSKMKVAKDSPKTTIQRTKSFPVLGHYSHGTVHSFLGASEGTEFIRTWKLPTPTKVVDKLKSALLGEMTSAEWELLEKKEWDDISQELPQPPLASESDANDNQRVLRGTESSECHVVGAEASSEPVGTSRLKGTSGWTKLRNR